MAAIGAHCTPLFDVMTVKSSIGPDPLEGPACVALSDEQALSPIARAAIPTTAPSFLVLILLSLTPGRM
jgi:hypothetical protein